MKEATGELNGTVIVFIAVAALTAFFFMVLWPMVKEGLISDANCASAICAAGYNPSTGKSPCYNPEDSNREIFECPYRG